MSNIVLTQVVFRLSQEVNSFADAEGMEVEDIATAFENTVQAQRQAIMDAMYEELMRKDEVFAARVWPKLTVVSEAARTGK